MSGGVVVPTCVLTRLVRISSTIGRHWLGWTLVQRLPSHPTDVDGMKWASQAAHTRSPRLARAPTTTTTTTSATRGGRCRQRQRAGGGGGKSGRAGTKPLDQHAAANGPRTVGVSAHPVWRSYRISNSLSLSFAFLFPRTQVNIKQRKRQTS